MRISTPTTICRGHKDGQILLPLAIGFKAGGAIMSALTALKLLVLKTLAFSGLALLASLALTGKYLYDKLQQPLYEVTPYHYAPVQEVMQTWEPSYEVQQTHTDAFAVPVQETSVDQIGHFSNPVSLTANASQTLLTYGAGTQNTPTSQRKYFRASPMYRTTVYKTKYKG
ncbi:uncharacterized protein [Halyomorpha halys]|uniref:uncharacterized protein isoform X2 n=1 Tax=Halyomorpha halys TaxID=286706 RepID=UPI0034D2C8CF